MASRKQRLAVKQKYKFKVKSPNSNKITKHTQYCKITVLFWKTKDKFCKIKFLICDLCLN